MDGRDQRADRLSEAAFRDAVQPKTRRIVEVDVEKYQHLLDDPALSDSQREEFLNTLWLMMLSFVEIGWGVHPLQKACGKLSKNDAECGNSAENVVELKDQPD